jgi:hypothetical protein
MLWFTLQGIYFASTLAPGLPPDEMFHLQIIDLYQRSPHIFPLSASNTTFSAPTEEMARFGTASRFPYLYHFAFGSLASVLNLKVFNFSTIVFLRLINLSLSIFTLYLSVRIFRRLLPSAQARVLALVMPTSAVMYVVNSAAVSYDNLLNLLAAASFLLLIRFLNAPRCFELLLLCCVLLAASLVKISFLPLGAAIFLASLALLILRKRKKLPLFSAKTPLISSLLLLLLLIPYLLLVAEFYLGNISLYQTLLPSCRAIYSDSICREHYKFYFLEVASEDKSKCPANALLALPAYALLWGKTMLERSFGIYSHISLKHPEGFIYAIFSFFLLAAALSLYYFRLLPAYIKTLYAISLLYLFFLLVFRNFPFYLRTCNPLHSLHGRYLFIISPLLCSFLCFGLFVPLRKRTATVVAFLSALTLLYSGLPYVQKSEIFQRFTSPQDPAFYRHLTYFPNPIYDRSYRRIVSE